MDSTKKVNHIKKDTDIAVVLHAGDMAYADCDGGRWDSYANFNPLGGPYLVKGFKFIHP